MKKITFIFLIVSMLSAFYITQASAGNRIVWSGSSSGGPVPTSGSIPTNETSRTQQATYEAYMAILSYSNGLCDLSSQQPSWSGSCYSRYYDDDLFYCSSSACLNGTWDFSNGIYGAGPTCYTSPHGPCKSGYGTWDVVYDTTTTTITTTTVPTTTTTVICDSGSTVDADGDGKIDFLSSCCSNADGNCDYNDAQYDGTVIYIINSDGTQEVRKTYADVSFNAVTPVFHPTRDLTRNYCTNLSWGGIDTWLPLDELDIWKLASADYPFESNCSNYPDGCHIFSTSWSSKTVWTQPPSPWNAHLDLSLMYNQNWYRGWILKGCNGNELTANCNYWFAIRESDVYSYPKYETDPRWPTAQPMVICKANVSISTTTTVPTLIELAYYPFNGNANDESGNGNNGTVNGATLTTDRCGNANSAFSFDGSSNNYINCGHSSSFNFDTAFTFTAWIYPTTTEAGVIFMKWKYGVEDKYLWMRDQQIHFYLFDCFDSNQLASNTIPINQWIFVVATYDGTSAKIYINGVLDVSKTASGNVNDSTADLYIGYNMSGRTYNYEVYESFNGKIDDIYIYNQALSAQEIADLYSNGCPTLITLSAFNAIPKSNKVILQWSTESEIDNAGFNLYRSESENGNYTKINSSLIPAKGSSTQGASYEFTDNNVQNRKTYYYKLEDIDLNGNSTMHGPVSATPRLIYGIGKQWK
jgi:hypothetical protein